MIIIIIIIIHIQNWGESMDSTHKVFFALSMVLIIGGFFTINLLDSGSDSLSTFFDTGNSLTGLAVAELDGGGERVEAKVSSCWSLTTEATCNADANCQYNSDGWGSWCGEIGCWNYFNQGTCEAADLSCVWDAGGSSTSWCTEINCYSLDGTDQSSCETNSIGRTCKWVGEYDAANYQYPCVGSSGSCWEQNSETTCEAISGCTWVLVMS